MAIFYMMINQKSNHLIIFIIFLSVVAIAAIIVAVIPSLRSTIRDRLVSDERLILAKVSGPLYSNGPIMTAIKIKKGNDLILEIYSHSTEDSSEIQIARFKLEDSRDGYVTSGQNSTNLAFIDVDKDSVFEVVAPTFDSNMVARLNVYKYNEESKSFDKIRPLP